MDELKRLEEGLDKPDKMLRDAELQVIGKVGEKCQIIKLTLRPPIDFDTFAPAYRKAS